MRTRARLAARVVVLAIVTIALSLITPGAAEPATGPLGAPIHPADTPCVNGRPDEAGRSEPANDAYLDEHAVDWPVANPSDVGLDGARLHAGLLEAARAPTLLSLLIVRHGRLVVEEYFRGATASQSRNLHSATKSILGLLVGAAIRDGILPGLETPIGDLVAEAAGTPVGAVTLEQLLSMSGGLAQVKEPNLVRDVVALPLVTTPGERWEYSDASSELVALALERATPDGLCGYAHRVLGPLGITVDHWHVNPGGGVTGRAYAFLTPRELARVGQLVLQRGRWDGQQVIPADWFETMLGPRFDIDGGPYRGQGVCVGAEARRAYGLHWRIFEVSGRTAWTASGYGGQFLVVVPSLDLVMVVTHDTYHDAVMPIQRHLLPHAFLESHVLPGVEDAGPVSAGCTHDLVLARADGSDPVALAPHPAEDMLAEWAPDGSRIAFVSTRDLNTELYVVDRDGTGLDRLTHEWAVDIVPRWSPDGSRIAFLSDRGATSFGDVANLDVHVLDLATGEVHRVSPGLGDVIGVTWSPTGDRIAFVRSEKGDVLGDVWEADADGSRAETLLYAGRVGWPSWSPDGTRLAVVTGVGGEGQLAWRIGVLTLSSGNLTDLGEGTGPPIWSGDGRAIITSTETSEGPVMVLIDTATGERTLVDAVPGSRTSPDGRWIVFPQVGPVRH